MPIRHPPKPDPVVHRLAYPLRGFAGTGTVGGAGAIDSPVTAAVTLGLTVGKVAGISGAAWSAVRLQLAELPTGVGWRQLVGMAALAGVGFPVSLLLADAASPTATLTDQARVGVLAGSLLSAVMGSLLLGGALPRSGLPASQGPSPTSPPSRTRPTW